MQSTVSEAIAVGTPVVYANERSGHPHPDVQVGKVLSAPNNFGQVFVDWPGLPHLPQTHPVYRPQMKLITLDRLSPLT